jgi:hypothetical protein
MTFFPYWAWIIINVTLMLSINREIRYLWV